MSSLFAFFLQDQYDIIEKHTQSGLELVEKYVKFVKERTEIEQNYAKQLRQAQLSLPQSMCVYLCVFVCLHVKRLVMKCVWSLMTTLGQNQTCLRNTGLILQLLCALSLFLSLSLSLHSSIVLALSQLCPSVQAHIWCRAAELCWRGEEVGADWHMIDRKWLEAEGKNGEQLFYEVHSRL